jgi:hypothetical protein
MMIRASEPPMKVRQIPSGIGNVLLRAYDHVAPDVLWKLAKDDLAEIEEVCREESWLRSGSGIKFDRSSLQPQFERSSGSISPRINDPKGIKENL